MDYKSDKIINNIIESNLDEDYTNFIEKVNNYQKYINYIIRQRSMREIMDMDKKTFIRKLKNNLLPKFIPAKKDDNDYIKLYRDTNFNDGDDYCYNHRERLRTISLEDYKNLEKCFPINSNYYK